VFTAVTSVILDITSVVLCGHWSRLCWCSCRAYSKGAVQDAICAVQNEKLCSPKTQSWRHHCAVL